MGYYISHMIGIGSLGSENIEKILDIAKGMGIEFIHRGCISSELEANKGSQLVIAGTFNYWSYENASDFVIKLSEEFPDNSIMHMCWDMEAEGVNCQIWQDGKKAMKDVTMDECRY